jgi:membrane associated rhomboid family serine protease
MSALESQQPRKFGFIVAPTWVVYTLILTNVAIYVACAQGTERFTPNVSTLFRFGAVTASTLTDHQYWRLWTAGFLHFNPVHLVSNMLCLAIWGRPLEKRIGHLSFTLIYFCSLLAGSLFTVLAHFGLFIGAGASGAISGILGALLALGLRGKIELSLAYIGANITLNVILSATPGVDWRAHFGGFCAGVVAGAIRQRTLKQLPVKLELSRKRSTSKSTLIWVVMLLLLTTILLLSR